MEKDEIDLKFKATQWNNVSQAYQVQNFTELDAKIRNMQISDMSDYLLKTECEQSVKTAKDQAQLKYELKLKNYKEELGITETFSLLINKIIKKLK